MISLNISLNYDTTKYEVFSNSWHYSIQYKLINLIKNKTP